MEKNENVLWGEFGLQLEQKIRSFHQNVYPISIGNNGEELKYFASLITSEIHEIRKVSDISNQNFVG
jgi:aldehyde:ferredoxin oxidoreductase